MEKLNLKKNKNSLLTQVDARKEHRVVPFGALQEIGAQEVADREGAHCAAKRKIVYGI